MTTTRNAANGLVDTTMGLSHVPNSRFGEMVQLDTQRALRCGIEVFGLKNKATNESIEVAVTGDGAALTTTTKNAGQTAVGFKFIDVDAIDPIDNTLCYIDSSHSDDHSEDGASNRLRYKNAQTVSNCLVTGMCLHKETQDLLTSDDGFGKFFQFCSRASVDGVAADGGEPAFKPIKLVCTGDMKFLMELIGLGGACKNFDHFCHYCEVRGNGNHTMFDVSEGEFRCDICIHNDTEFCPHRDVNDDAEIQRKGKQLISWLLEDFQRRRNDPNLTIRDMMLEDPTECYNGYDTDGNRTTEPMNLRNFVTPEGELTRSHLLDYCNHLHTKEDPLVVADTKVSYDPCADNKDETNIDFDYTIADAAQKNVFLGNVMNDLEVRGLDIPFDHNAKVEMLRKHLIRGRYVKRYRDALLEHERSLRVRVFEPGI
jgi:hypothetical protein